MMGWLIALFHLSRPQPDRPCRVCKRLGATCCLPMLGGTRFCRSCAGQIMRGLR